MTEKFLITIERRQREYIKSRRLNLSAIADKQLRACLVHSDAYDKGIAVNAGERRGCEDPIKTSITLRNVTRWQIDLNNINLSATLRAILDAIITRELEPYADIFKQL